MIFFYNYLPDTYVSISIAVISGYVYGLLFVERQTGAFLCKYPTSAIYFLDILRAVILVFIMANVLLNDLLRSILIVGCFLLVFWMKLLYLKK